MNTPEPMPSPDPDGDNALQFWVAYIPGKGAKKNYLSDGKGNLRVFKSEQVLRDWLKPQLRQEVYEMVVVHSVQGQIALPDDGTFGLLRPELLGLGRIPSDVGNLKPIITMAPFTVPSTQELLESVLKRKRRRRH